MVLLTVVSMFCLAFWANSAQADLLGFTSDFYSDNSTVNYDAGTGSLTVSGYPDTFDLNGAPPPDYNIIASPNSSDFGTYNLNVLVNPATGALISGTLTITGALADNDLNSVSLPGLGSSNTLLQANIASISSAGDGELHLTFNVTGGDVVPAYFPQSQGLIQLHCPGSYAGDWYAGSFISDGAYSDTYANPVPEPGTVSLLSSFFAACLATFIFRRSHKSRLA
jgi:hypothetical protein